MRLQEKLTNSLLEDLFAGEIDMMVGVDIPFRSGLAVVPLAQEQLHCIMNEVLLRDYFPDQWHTMKERFVREGVDLMEIKELPLIMPSPSNRLRQPVDQLFRKNNTHPHVILEVLHHHAGGHRLRCVRPHGLPNH